MEALPRAFYELLPIGMVQNWCYGINAASVVLQTLHLAKDTPDKVLLMPLLLKHASPEALSGGMVTLLAVAGGIVGVFASTLSDLVGGKAACKATLAAQTAGLLLTAWPSTYLIGLTVSYFAGSACTPIFTSLFTSQFDDERLTQKLVTYLYAFGNCAFLLATVVAGVQPFWLGYLECAALCAGSLICLVVMSSSLTDSKEKAGSPDAQPPRAPRNDMRVYAYGVLCVFTLLFWALFMQFLGGPFMVFAAKESSPLGGFHVPAPWFLSLNGLLDLFLGVPLGWMYERVIDLRFHQKFRISFLMMTVGFGILALAARLAPYGGVSSLALAASVLFISLGELHYNPVMLAAISSEMPSNMVGLFTGVHFMLGGLGNGIAGIGVPLYASMGSGVFFTVVCSLAAAGTLCLQLIAPWLTRCFEEDSKSECLLLHQSKRHSLDKP